MIESGSIAEAKSDTTPGEVGKAQENYENVKALTRVTGIGPVKAQKLVDEGITLETLLEAYTSKDKELLETLTHHQLLGVKHFHDLEKRIPHSEITEIKGFLESILKSINNDLSFIILGSYRREAVTSGDIDILVYHTGIHTLEQAESTTYLSKFKEILIQHRFLVDHLTMKGTTKYMGFGKYRDNPVRRIDIRFIALESLGAAMLYFTGSGEFNKNMRTFALKNGYTINEYGIYKLKSNRKTKDYIVPTETEEDIFKVLGLQYIDPPARTRYVKFQ
jgi:DNA polymerase/3'-5' exonuclease PolX